MINATWRLFCIQASWNYESMLGLGVGYASEPLLRSLPGGVDGERYRAAVARSASYFNAHPYFAGLAVGAICRAEHDGEPGDKIARLRTALAGPLGSVGDRLIWAGTLPAASAAGLLLTAVGPRAAGPIALLVIHNAAHLVVRLWGLPAGWRLGTRLARALAVPPLVVALRLAGPVAALLLGVALPIAAAWLVRDLDLAGRVAAGAMFVVAAVIGRWLTPQLRGARLGLLAAAAVLIGVSL